MLGLPRNVLGNALAFGAGLLLLADTFAPWQRLSLGGFTYSENAWHCDKGVIIGCLTIALVGWSGALLAGLRLSNRLVADTATLTLSVFTLIFAVVMNIRADDPAWGGFVAIPLALVAVAGAALAYQADAQTEPVPGTVSVSG